MKHPIIITSSGKLINTTKDNFLYPVMGRLLTQEMIKSMEDYFNSLPNAFEEK